MDARFASNVLQAQKSFRTHQMEILGDVGRVNLVSAHLETVLVLSKISARFCAKCTTSSVIVLDTLDVTPR
jgi:hypothetical protein